MSWKRRYVITARRTSRTGLDGVISQVDRISDLAPRLITDVGHQPRDLLLLIGSQGQQWKAGATAVVAIQITGEFHSRNSHLTANDSRRVANALLFLRGQALVAFLPRHENLAATLRRTSPKGHYGARGAFSKPGVQGACATR